MSIVVFTKEDLEMFRLDLLEDLKKILQPTQVVKNEWLRGSDVRKLLKISAGTLQNLRISGLLHPSKLGGILYYRRDEITELLENANNDRKNHAGNRR